MLSKKQSFIQGALIISLGGFISKILGALYRIPLTNILGGEGMGIYQMVYPLYCILLTVSASGIPTGIARLISSGNGTGAEKRAFMLYGLIGVAGTFLMYALAGPLASVQHESAIRLCCVMLCPSVFFVSMLSVVRGYFQGRGNMYPTAVTEVSEQLIKVALGCTLAYIFRHDMNLAVASTLFAVTVSEAVSTLIAVYWYRRNRTVQPLFRVASVSYGAILGYTVPLTFTAIAMPVSQLVESIVAVNLLRNITDGATSLYGIFSGCAITIINLPVSVTYGLAAASVPQISPLAEKGDEEVTYDSKGKAEVDKAGRLPTLIGEFASNNHVIEKNGLTSSFGTLKMFYYSDEDDINKKAAILNSFDQVLVHDYKYNRATSVFSMQMGASSSYSEANYCVFAKLKNEAAEEKLRDLMEAVSDYISDNGLSSKFTTTVETVVDKLDSYSGTGGIETKFTMTYTPIIIKSVQITKY